MKRKEKKIREIRFECIDLNSNKFKMRASEHRTIAVDGKNFTLCNVTVISTIHDGGSLTHLLNRSTVFLFDCFVSLIHCPGHRKNLIIYLAKHSDHITV